MSPLEKYIEVSQIPKRESCDAYLELVSGLELKPEIKNFFLNYTPHGIRTIGLWAFTGQDSSLECEKEHKLSKSGYFIFGGGQGYLVVRLEDSIPGWLPFGSLEPPEIHTDFVPYPESFADFMFACETEEDFPFDSYEAEERYQTTPNEQE